MIKLSFVLLLLLITFTLVSGTSQGLFQMIDFREKSNQLNPFQGGPFPDCLRTRGQKVPPTCLESVTHILQ